MPLVPGQTTDRPQKFIPSTNIILSEAYISYIYIFFHPFHYILSETYISDIFIIHTVAAPEAVPTGSRLAATPGVDTVSKGKDEAGVQVPLPVPDPEVGAMEEGSSHIYIYFFTPSTIFSLRLTTQIFLSYAQSRCPLDPD